MAVAEAVFVAHAFAPPGLCKKIFLYAKNLEQDRYQDLVDVWAPMSRQEGYEILTTSNDKIIPVSELPDGEKHHYI